MIEQLRQELKQAGYSLTKPRLTIFSALQSSKPRTMRELIDSVSNVVDRASVYRIVALFEALGIVNRIQHGWKYKLELSDSFAPHHHHFTCLNCHRVISFEEPIGFDVMIVKLATEHRFLPKSHTLEINGLCSQCRGQFIVKT